MDSATQITSFSMAGLYMLMFLLATIVYRHFIKWNYHHINIPNSMLFIISFDLGCLVRAFDFIAIAWSQTTSNPFSHSIQFLLDTAPTFMFFATYMAWLHLWSEIYLQLQQQKSRFLTHKWLFHAAIVIQTIMYGTVILMYVFDVVLHQSADYERVVMGLTSAGYLVATIAFFCYSYAGYSLNVTLHQIVRTERQNKILRRVGALAMVCVVSFLARAIVTGIQMKYPIPFTPESFAPYYTFLEALPLLIMLAVLSAAHNMYRDSEASPLIP